LSLSAARVLPEVAMATNRPRHILEAALATLFSPRLQPELDQAPNCIQIRSRSCPAVNLLNVP
jgi:hypothetical protein